jgi:hypothetical protein
MSVKAYLDAYWDSKVKYLKAVINSGLKKDVEDIVNDTAKKEDEQEERYKH